MLRTALQASRLIHRQGQLRQPWLNPTSLSIARRYLSQEVRAKIRNAVSATPVVLFMKGTPEAPQCGFSRATVQILDLHGVPTQKLKAFNVLEDAELRSAIKEFSDWPTIPQVYVNGEFIGGCDIILGMHQSGELESLLEKHGIIPPVEADSNAPPSST